KRESGALMTRITSWKYWRPKNADFAIALVIALNQLVENYVGSPEFAELRAKHRQVDVHTDLEEDLLHIRGSAVHIYKVLMNMVVNAVEAVEGGGVVTISTSNRYLDEPLASYDSVRIGEYVVLSVSDNGPGIDADDLERIFEPFYTKKTMGRSGTGLGLAVVWNCVKDHDGYIDLQSNSEGTCFNIYLHATRERPEEMSENGPSALLRGNGEKILVVDDEAQQRTLICEILSHVGYVCHAVADGVAACAYVAKHKVDLVVLDMIMPASISGRETYARLLKMQPGLCAIIVSGYAETEDVKQTIKMGAGKYLKKPFKMSTLTRAVTEVLRKSPET
ncbi:MAG: response regulator, partial [Deltaproteobacteria bacterium]|nr:response regulator [Deltaproteobacteria bacterium]